MDDTLNLVEMEEKTYGEYHRDGLLDLVIGLGIAGWGLGIMNDVAFIGAISVAILQPIWMVLRKIITYPRIGYVAFRKERVAKEKSALMKLALFGTFTFLLGIVAWFAFSGNGFPDWMTTIVQTKSFVILTGLMSLGLVLAGLLFKMQRFHLYAVLLFGSTVIFDAFGLRFDISMFIAGCLILVTALSMLTRFIKNNPKPDELDNANG